MHVFWAELSRRNSVTEYRSCGRTSAASPRVNGKGCFLYCCSVLTADVGPVLGILSERKCCGMCAGAYLGWTVAISSDVEGFQEDWLHCRREDQEKSIREDKRQLA